MKLFIFIIVGIITKQVSAVEPACYAGNDPPLCDACGGTCDGDNGCNCYDGSTQCFPTDCIMGSNDCCDMHSGWYYDSTMLCCTQTFQCNPRCASDEICVNSSGIAECLCNVAVYKDQGIGDFKPTVSCSDDGTMITSLSKCELQALGYNFSSVHLFNTSGFCIYAYPNIQNDISMINVQVQAVIGWCGNTATVGSSDIYFTNNLHIEAYSGPLITKNPLSFNFSCVFNRTMQTSLNFFLNPISSTITVPSENGISSYTVTLAAYSDKTCTLPLEGTDTLDVGSVLYLGIFSPDLNGDAFFLRAEKCFATPTNDANSSLNVILVEGGCAADGSVPTTVLENGKSTEARIEIISFLFQGYNDIFIFCSVTICNKSEDCSKCNPSRAADIISPVLSIKLNLEDLNNYEYSNSGHVTGVSWALLVSTLLAYFYIKPF